MIMSTNERSTTRLKLSGISAFDLLGVAVANQEEVARLAPPVIPIDAVGHRHPRDQREVVAGQHNVLFACDFQRDGNPDPGGDLSPPGACGVHHRPSCDATTRRPDAGHSPALDVDPGGRFALAYLSAERPGPMREAQRGSDRVGVAASGSIKALPMPSTFIPGIAALSSSMVNMRASTPSARCLTRFFSIAGRIASVPSLIHPVCSKTFPPPVSRSKFSKMSTDRREPCDDILGIVLSHEGAGVPGAFGRELASLEEDDVGVATPCEVEGDACAHDAAADDDDVRRLVHFRLRSSKRLTSNRSARAILLLSPVIPPATISPTAGESLKP